MGKRLLVWPYGRVGGVLACFRPHPAAAPPSRRQLRSPPPARPSFQIEAATEAEIGAHVATSLTVFRFAANPHILVLDFASLHEQGMMLNRIAAFVEEGGTAT